MSEGDVDEFGPVDYLVVEFPQGKSQFHGEMAAAHSIEQSTSLIAHAAPTADTAARPPG